MLYLALLSGITTVCQCLHPTTCMTIKVIKLLRDIKQVSVWKMWNAYLGWKKDLLVLALVIKVSDNSITQISYKLHLNKNHKMSTLTVHHQISPYKISPQQISHQQTSSHQILPSLKLIIIT